MEPLLRLVLTVWSLVRKPKEVQKLLTQPTTYSFLRVLTAAVLQGDHAKALRMINLALYINERSSRRRVADYPGFEDALRHAFRPPSWHPAAWVK